VRNSSSSCAKKSPKLRVGADELQGGQSTVTDDEHPGPSVTEAAPQALLGAHHVGAADRAGVILCADHPLDRVTEQTGQQLDLARAERPGDPLE